jgi:hypothetical protein
METGVDEGQTRRIVEKENNVSRNINSADYGE